MLHRGWTGTDFERIADGCAERSVAPSLMPRMYSAPPTAERGVW